MPLTQTSESAFSLIVFDSVSSVAFCSIVFIKTLNRSERRKRRKKNRVSKRRLIRAPVH